MDTADGKGVHQRNVNADSPGRVRDSQAGRPRCPAVAAGVWPGKVVTEIKPAGEFWEAEERRKKRSAESADFVGSRAWLMTGGRHDSREHRANLIQKDH